MSRLVEVVVKIEPSQYQIFSDVAKAVGVTVETLLNQEVASAVHNACCWAERGSMLRD